jgi:hypothetical protein
MEAIGELHVPAALTPEKNPAPLNSRLGGPQGRPERFGEERRLLHLSGFEPPASSGL